MSRYQIAIQLNNEKAERSAYRFPATNYVARAAQYIRLCVREKAMYIADNVPQNVLDAAVVSVSETLEVPVVVSTDSKACLFSISHSQKIYSLDNLPPSRYVICYNCSDSKLTSAETKALVIVYGHAGDMKFI